MFISWVSMGHGDELASFSTLLKAEPSLRYKSLPTRSRRKNFSWFYPPPVWHFAGTSWIGSTGQTWACGSSRRRRGKGVRARMIISLVRNKRLLDDQRSHMQLVSSRTISFIDVP